QKQRDRVDCLISIANPVHFLTSWPAMVFFLIWFYQAASNSRNLHASGIAYSPAKAVASFFIPIGNLVMPYLAMQETWRASNPDPVKDKRPWQQTPGSWLILLWWIALIMAAILALVSTMTRRSDQFGIDHESFVLAGGCNICMIVAGVTLIMVIRQIAQRQRA